MKIAIVSRGRLGLISFHEYLNLDRNLWQMEVLRGLVSQGANWDQNHGTSAVDEYRVATREDFDLFRVNYSPDWMISKEKR